MKKKISYVLVTPAMALEWLKKNKNLRSISDRRVAGFVALIRAGLFKSTHQGIAFDVDGYLRDGQHRLKAICVTEIAQWMSVAYGLEEEDIAAIDTGWVRSTSTVLGSQFGELVAGRSANRFTAVCSAIQLLERRDHAKTDAHILADFYLRNRAGIDVTLSFLGSKPKVPASVLAAIAWVHSVEPQAACTVASSLAQLFETSSTAPSPGPVTALYSAIIRRRDNGDMPINMMFKTARAIQATANGERLVRLENSATALNHYIDRRRALGYSVAVYSDTSVKSEAAE